MRLHLSLCIHIALLVLVSSFASAQSAQIGFELQTPCNAFPEPCGAPGDPEGISWNGGAVLGSGLATVSSWPLPGCGFPVTGSQYAWIAAGGPASVPPGGPLPRPALPPMVEACIPIPPGATSLSFSWDFYCPESAMNAAFNDGVSIDILDAGGSVIQALAYGDTFSPRGSCTATSSCAVGSGAELAPDGPQVSFASFPGGLPAGARLSVACWNGGDNQGFSAVALDNVTFGGVTGATVTPTENCAVSLVARGGVGACPSSTNADATRVLDLPSSNDWFSLCAGQWATYQLGVTVLNRPGADLQIEEVNSSIAECFRVQVSADGTGWVEIPGPYPSCVGGGGVWAGDAAIDLAGFAVIVRFVRLIGASGSTAGTSPGPDIDAIVAVNYVPPTFGGVVRRYATRLIHYDQGATTTATLTGGLEALGSPNAHRSETWNGSAWQGTYHGFVSLGAGAELVALFDTWISDGPGADLVVHEYLSPEGDQYIVQASDDAFHWHPMTLVGDVSPTHGAGAVVTNNMRAFDLAGTGLARADYVRLVSISGASSGGTPGPEIDALESIHPLPKLVSLTGGPLLQGTTTTLNVFSHASLVGHQIITLPSATPPLPAGSGLVIGPGAEVRLSLSDPLLNFAAFEPQASAFFSGTVSTVAIPSLNSVLVTVPAAPPSLSGLDIWWQSALLPTGTGQPAVSNVLLTRVP